MKNLTRMRPCPVSVFVTQNRTVLASDWRGFIDCQAFKEHGLFVQQTRLLSHLEYLINGEPPKVVSQSNVAQHTWLGYYLVCPREADIAEAAQQAVELKVSRFVGDGLHEDLDLTNHTQKEVDLNLALRFDADFADQKESHKRQQTGEIQKDWQQLEDGRWQLSFDYRAEREFHQQNEQGKNSIHAGIRIRPHHCSSPPVYENDQITFAVRLPAHGHWHACLEMIAVIDGQELPLHYTCRSFGSTSNDFDVRRQTFLDHSTGYQVHQLPQDSLASTVLGALEQAKSDLASLRLYDVDKDANAWMPAAGIPMFLAIFGRDSITAAWQAGLLSADLMKGALQELAKWQGKEDNPWRDEEPGKMVHQVDTGPLAKLNFNPLARYYGSITTSTFYPVALSELWHWTGDKELVGRLLDPALRCLKWLETADLDGDGFYEYRTRSEQGLENQGWKDSGDAIVDEEGRQVKAPIAICEEQGFAYAAKLQMAELLWWFKRKDEAKALYHEASELKKRFNGRFWLDQEKFFAMGLAQGKRLHTIASNPGHCIATGIVDHDLVAATAARLFKEDLFSGWGIRTLSSANPAYNPYSYHRGSIWPVEQGAFAIGFYRYGLHEYVEKLSKAQFEAAGLFDLNRLPECFCGHPRDIDHPFPPSYPRANSPQAWSSSSIFCLLQALLGLYPYAPLHMLFVDPHLPAWLDSIVLKDLRVGEAIVSIEFYRNKSGDSDYRVLAHTGPIHVMRQPSPWSLTARPAERVKDFFTSLLPD